jgi:uncharacterized damage-inducible protein DinB
VQLNPAQAPNLGNIPQPSNLQEVLTAFEESVVTVRNLLRKVDDDGMQETWRMVKDDREVLAIPRAEFLRDIMLNHWYQHRGQFCVYLRMLNVPVPASWGPSADEQPVFLQKRQSA